MGPRTQKDARPVPVNITELLAQIYVVIWR